jgi:hypothetical protein
VVGAFVISVVALRLPEEKSMISHHLDPTAMQEQ